MIERNKLSKEDPHYKQLSPSNRVKNKTILKTQREYVINNKLKYLITKRKNKDDLSVIRYDIKSTSSGSSKQNQFVSVPEGGGKSARLAIDHKNAVSEFFHAAACFVSQQLTCAFYIAHVGKRYFQAFAACLQPQ